MSVERRILFAVNKFATANHDSPKLAVCIMVSTHCGVCPKALKEQVKQVSNRIGINSYDLEVKSFNPSDYDKTPENLSGRGFYTYPFLYILVEHTLTVNHKFMCVVEGTLTETWSNGKHIIVNPRLFAIRDSRSNLGSNMMFWRAGGGYTSNINEADLFTLEEAQKQHNCRHTDVPTLLSKLKEKACAAVDCQHLPNDDNYQPNSPYVIQKKGVWNGNDIAFVVDFAGGTSYDYNKAHVFDEKEAFNFISSDISNANYQIWSKSDIDKIVRSSVAATHFDKQAMMLDAGIVENVPPKPKPERYNCHSCGKFVSFETYYGTCYHGHPCPKCED